MEPTLKQLEAEIEKLKVQVDEGLYAKNYLDIWKLMSLYSHLYYMGKNEEIPNLFAQETNGVTMEMEDSGVYEGIESIRRFWTEVFDVNRMQRTPGWLAVHITANPVLEIDRSRNKAKGIWHSHGYVSMCRGEVYKQNACMGKYCVDYIKEGDQWKFFHFNYRIAFMCDWQKGWVEKPVVASIAGNPMNRPDKPTTYHMPYDQYRINQYEPGPPEPYDD
jgi:hypothetical protein